MKPTSTAVLLCNLGTPDAPTPEAVRRYLAEFLSDARVVEIPKLLWWPILHGFILRTRPAVTAAKYQGIWLPDTSEGSPLRFWTAQQASALQQQLPGTCVRYAMRYGQPSIASVLDELQAQNIERVIVVPLYPQYSAATTASVYDAVFAWSQKVRRLPELHFVNNYHEDSGYINALAEQVRTHWHTYGQGEQLLISFHGIPQRSQRLGDPYAQQCYQTAELLVHALGLRTHQYRVSFQSRFGKARWLEPATEATLIQLAKQGTRHIDVICPGFSADCLETLEEINIEAREAFINAGGLKFNYIPCLNDHPAWIQALAHRVKLP